MKEIIFLNTNKAWGGGEKWHFETAQYLKSNGYKVRMICYPDSELAKKAKTQKLTVSELKISKSSFLNPIKCLMLKRLLSSGDKILLNLPQDFKIGTKVAFDLNYKVILYRRGMPNPIKNTKLNKSLFNKLTHIIANSENISRSLIKNTKDWFPIKKVSILYNGIYLHEYPDKIRRSHGEMIKLGSASRLVTQKSIEETIEVARILNQRHFNFTLSIAGKGPEKEKIQSLINKYKLQDKVQLVGHQRDIKSFLNQIDYFISTSHFEGSANTLIEAMATKRICFAYDISSMPEVIDNGQDGYLARFKDVQMMASQIIEHSNSKMAENAYSKVKEKFNYQQNMKALLEILK